MHTIFIQLYHGVTSGGNFIPALVTIVVFSFLFSLPGFLLYYLIVYFLYSTKINNILIKLIGAAAAVIFMVLTANFLRQIMGGDLNHPKIIFFLTAYFVSIVLFSLLYNISNQNSL